MIELKDQMNNTIRLGNSPKRIVSLVPSQTEFLYDIGLDSKVVGITKFCIHPTKWFNPIAIGSKTRVGGTKTVNFEKIKALNPDLIIANKEENTQAEIEALQKLYTVYVSDIFTLKGSFKMMSDIGILTNKVETCNQIINSIQQNFTNLPQINQKVLYLIWRKPFMCAGQHTFISHLLNLCGLENGIQNKLSRYDELTINQIKNMDIDFIFLSSEPYPFKEKHIHELQSQTNAKVMLVDGEMFSWYGSRLTKFKDYYNNQLLKKLNKT